MWQWSVELLCASSAKPIAVFSTLRRKLFRWISSSISRNFESIHITIAFTIWSYYLSCTIMAMITVMALVRPQTMWLSNWSLLATLLLNLNVQSSDPDQGRNSSAGPCRFLRRHLTAIRILFTDKNQSIKMRSCLVSYVLYFVKAVFLVTDVFLIILSVSWCSLLRLGLITSFTNSFGRPKHQIVQSPTQPLWRPIFFLWR